ncbi:hypothetical protein [Corynebacterium striatum]|nr:conserved hypothetical protein [Corynebacterium striatum]
MNTLTAVIVTLAQLLAMLDQGAALPAQEPYCGLNQRWLYVQEVGIYACTSPTYRQEKKENV